MVYLSGGGNFFLPPPPAPCGTEEGGASPKAAEISREIIEERLKSVAIQPLGLILRLISVAIIVFASDFSRNNCFCV